MDSVQFQNLSIGVNELNSPQTVNRKQTNAVTNPAVTQTKIPEYRPASYTTAVTVRTTLTTK
jgi:hypothetical protein